MSVDDGRSFIASDQDNSTYFCHAADKCIVNTRSARGEGANPHMLNVDKKHRSRGPLREMGVAWGMQEFIDEGDDDMLLFCGSVGCACSVGRRREHGTYCEQERGGEGSTRG